MFNVLYIGFVPVFDYEVLFFLGLRDRGGLGCDWGGFEDGFSFESRGVVGGGVRGVWRGVTVFLALEVYSLYFFGGILDEILHVSRAQDGVHFFGEKI